MEPTTFVLAPPLFLPAPLSLGNSDFLSGQSDAASCWRALHQRSLSCCTTRSQVCLGQLMFSTFSCASTLPPFFPAYLLWAVRQECV